MICQGCHLVEASVQFTEVMDEQKRTHWLCSGCAQTRGLFVSVSTPTGLDTSEIAGVGDAPAGLALRRCACGTNLVSIRRSGRVGCADCYETFADILEPLLKRVHGCTEHGGGQP